MKLPHIALAIVFISVFSFITLSDFDKTQESREIPVTLYLSPQETVSRNIGKDLLLLKDDFPISPDVYHIGKVIDLPSFERLCADEQALCLKRGQVFVCSPDGKEGAEISLLELCVEDLYPEFILQFMGCIDSARKWQSCAISLGLDTESISDCTASEKGLTLFKKSAIRTESIEDYPQIMVAGSNYSCNTSPELLRSILCNALNSTSGSCLGVPDILPVNLTIISDTRCENCPSYIRKVVTQLRCLFPKLEIFSSFSTDDLTNMDINYVPAFIFGPEIERTGVDLSGRFKKMKGRYIYISRQLFFPFIEICDNSKDDDGDKIIDCKDDDCKDDIICRDETPNKIDLIIDDSELDRFIPRIKDLIESLDYSLDLDIYFLGNSTPRSIEFICSMYHYPAEFEYLEVFGCGDCSERVMKCISSDEGDKLKRAKKEQGSAFGILKSGTWIINNRFTTINPDSVKELFCEHNPHSSCEKRYIYIGLNKQENPDAEEIY